MPNGNSIIDADSDMALESGGDVAAVIQTIDQKSKSVRGPYNSLGDREVRGGAEQIVAFLNAVRQVHEDAGEQGDKGFEKTLRDCLARMVLTRTSFTDFRSKSNLDSQSLADEVNRALQAVGQEVQREKRDTELFLDNVILSSQWSHKAKPVENAADAASKVQAFVSSTLGSSVGKIQSVGDSQHFVARQGWRVPVTLRSGDGQEHQGEVMIYDDGEIKEKTRGMLKNIFGMQKADEE